MGQYYIFTNDGVYYELDATTEVEVTHTGEATDFPVESGQAVSDNYVNNPTRVSFSGVISDIKSSENRFAANPRLDTKSYVEGLLKMKTSRETFTVCWAGNFSVIDNCVFESISIKQDKKHGSDHGLSSYKIDFVAKQIRFAEQASILAASQQDPEHRDVFQAMSSASGNTQEVRTGSLEEETVLEKTRDQQIEEQKELLRQLLGIE